MTETEFLEAAEKLFERVENIIDEDGLDVDSDRAGNVLTLEADNGEQVVINLHAPTQQVWLASRQGGLHFMLEDGIWRSTRDKVSFWSALSRALTFVTGEPVTITQD